MAQMLVQLWACVVWSATRVVRCVCVGVEKHVQEGVSQDEGVSRDMSKVAALVNFTAIIRTSAIADKSYITIDYAGADRI